MQNKIAQEITRAKIYPARFTYRFKLLNTFDEGNQRFLFGDDPTFFGGVTPSAWSNSHATADQVNLESLDRVLTQSGQGGANALIINESFSHNSDQEAHLLLMHFQVENTQNVEVSWPLQFMYSSYDIAGQRSSIALNGGLVWNNGVDVNSAPDLTGTVTLNLPPTQVSDVIIAISASTATLGVRHLLFAFNNDSLTLPDGVRYMTNWR